MWADTRGGGMTVGTWRPMRALLAVAALGALVTGCGAAAPRHPSWSQPPAITLQAGAKYSAVVDTSFGSFTIGLFADQDPVAVNNFIFLAKQNFYNGDKFFRIVKTFMIQTGDPNNNGTGGPGYRFADELPPPQSYAPGIVAMANSGPNTNGSQFFICTGKDCSNLDQMPNYTQLGQVTAGMDVVQKIAAIPTTMNPNAPTPEQSVPTQDAHIIRITIQQA